MTLGHLQGKRVLVIDDSDAMRSQLQQTLSGAGCGRLLTVPNIRQALEALKAESFDIILCDYYLGESTDGQQFLEHLRTNDLISRHTLFIMITAEQGYQRVVQAAECAPDDYFLKPFTAAQFNARLHRVLEKQDALQAVSKATDRKDWLAVIRACDALLESGDRHAFEALKIKGSALLKLGRAGEAEALYRQVIATRALPWARHGLARALATQGDVQAASDVLEENIAEAPEHMASYELLSRLRQQSGDLGAALHVLERAQAVAPGTMARVRHLGDLALQAGRPEVAEQVLGEALQRHRFSPVREAADYARLAQSMTRQNKAKQALAPLVQAKREFRDEQSELLLSAHEVIALRGAGEVNKAEQLMKGLIERAQHVMPGDTAMAIAEACYLTGHEQAGEKMLAHAVQNAPEDQRVHGQARAVLRAAGKSDEHGDALIETNQRQVILLNNEGVAKAESGDLEAAISLLSNAADRLPNNVLIVSNAALVIAKQMLVRGQDAELLRTCLRYRAAVAQQSPAHPKLQQIDTLLSRLRKPAAT